MSILDELEKSGKYDIVPVKDGPSFGQRISRNICFAVQKFDTYMKGPMWELSDWIFIPIVVMVILLFTFGFYKIFDYGIGLTEANTTQYSLAKTFVEDYPQLTPLLREAMKDGKLTDGEYRKIRNGVNEIVKRRDVDDLEKVLNEQRVKLKELTR